MTPVTLDKPDIAALGPCGQGRFNRGFWGIHNKDGGMMTKAQKFKATFEYRPGDLDEHKCTIEVQGKQVLGEGRSYDEALESCFVKVRETMGSPFWRLLELDEL